MLNVTNYFYGQRRLSSRDGRHSWGMIVLSQEQVDLSRMIPSFQKKTNA